ncbi:hypothetical protein MPER_11666, partial [Moniliophthora perniciosa FA553]
RFGMSEDTMKKYKVQNLTHFSGPALAKRTWLYRFYYDVIVGGGWLSQLERLHKVYGPVVRVGPKELHFADPAAYADIYSSPAKLPKDLGLYEVFQFGLPPDLFTKEDPKAHAVIKSRLVSFFSRQAILKLEHAIQEQLRQKPGRHPSKHASRILLIQVTLPSNTRISTVSTKESQPSSDLARITCGARFCAPTSYGGITDYDLEDQNVFYTVIRNARDKGQSEHQVTREYLICEGLDLRIAGSETVGNACYVGARCLIRDDRVGGKLTTELDEAWPDRDAPMPLERLEKFPYLTAAIKESLRLSHGVVTPMTRIVPDSGVTITGHFVPPKTVVWMANTFVHLNADIFPEPNRFYPERWTEAKDRSLDKYLLPFGKGPRSCLAINLGWSELYLILGNVFRKLELNSASDLG